MVMTDTNSSIITKIDDDVLKYDAIGIGPGLGTASETRAAVKELLSIYRKPIVLDADALNGLSMEKNLPSLPPGLFLLRIRKNLKDCLVKVKMILKELRKH
jgi:NAD(P)H-hydrate epimerase